MLFESLRVKTKILEILRLKKIFSTIQNILKFYGKKK